MDRELFWKRLEPEHPRAEAFCRKISTSREEGDDLYQDALLLALRKFDTLKDHSAFRPWLYRIIVNCFTSRTRRPWWRRHATLTPELLETRRGDDPEEVYTARRWLQRAFGALNAEEQTLVTLYELEGWSLDDLARTYGSNPGAIKARLFRCRRKMRKRLKRYLSGLETTINLKEADNALRRSETST
jgi:RNA polymerase sigma-70 factor (ECF subfamily)